MMGTRVVTEEEIERYLRAPETLAPEAKDRVERALRVSDEAHRVAESIRSFYEQMNALEGGGGTHSEHVVDLLFAGESVLHLQVVRHHRRSIGRTASQSQTLMAAATDAPTRPRVVSTSYGKEGSDILVRVLHDRISQNHELYVLADDPASCAYALVSFPQIGLDIATDEGAHASFTAPTEVEPETWAELEAVIHLPLSTSTVDLGNVGPHGTGGVRGIIARDHLVELSREEEVLIVRVSARRKGAPIVSMATLTDSSGRVRLTDLSAGEGRVGLARQAAPHTLRLYG